MVAFFSVSAMFGVHMLLSYHVRLLKNNTTTNEDYKSDDSPYDLGTRNKNMRHVSSTPIARLIRKFAKSANK